MILLLHPHFEAHGTATMLSPSNVILPVHSQVLRFLAESR